MGEMVPNGFGLDDPPPEPPAIPSLGPPVVVPDFGPPVNGVLGFGRLIIVGTSNPVVGFLYVIHA